MSQGHGGGPQGPASRPPGLPPALPGLSLGAALTGAFPAACTASSDHSGSEVEGLPTLTRGPGDRPSLSVLQTGKVILAVTQLVSAKPAAGPTCPWALLGSRAFPPPVETLAVLTAC